MLRVGKEVINTKEKECFEDNSENALNTLPDNPRIVQENGNIIVNTHTGNGDINGGACNPDEELIKLRSENQYLRKLLRSKENEYENILKSKNDEIRTLKKILKIND